MAGTAMHSKVLILILPRIMLCYTYDYLYITSSLFKFNQRFMIPEPEVIIKKLILSIKGELELDCTPNLIVLPHEYLHPQISKNTSKPIGTQTLNYHRKNMLSLQNTSVTPTLIDHQIHTMLTNQAKQPQVLIVDASPFGGIEKTADVFKKYYIVRGYGYQLPSSLLDANLQQLSKQTEVLISYEHIKKEVQYVFGVISEEQRGFIGQFDLPHHYQMVSSTSKFYKQAIQNLVRSYESFSTQTQCPFYVSLLQYGCDGFFSTFSNKGSNPTISLPILLEFLMKELLTTKQCYKNIVLINPHFSISTQIDNKTIKYRNQHENLIKQLYSFGFTICFDLSRYQNQLCLTWIAQYIKEFPNQTIVSPGLRYKTDFIQFGGDGLQLQQSLLHIERILENQYSKLINIAMKQNVIRLLTWYQKKIIKVQVKMWKCLKCGKQQPETVESFRKFGKDFCSIDCVRSFKF